MWNVFITGATGFLGGELLIALSQLDSVEKVACLVRADSTEEARVRLEHVFAVHRNHYDGSKVFPIAGDLTNPQLAADLAGRRELTDVNLVIHSGANTSFLGRKSRVIEDTNVLGTRRIASWASALKGLETFLYVGTATIVGAGDDVRGRTVFEDESPNSSATHLLEYTRSKMFAEMAARTEIPHDKLLITRPSILLGDSRPIVPRSFDIAWIIIAIEELRMFFGNPDASCDIIPADYAANAIVALLTAHRQHRTYHVSAGIRATTCRQLGNAVDYSGPNKPSLVFCPMEDLEPIKKWLRGREPMAPSLARYSKHLEYIRYGIGVKKARIMLSGLDAYWNFINLDQRFDNSRLLADTKIGLPAPAHEYVKQTAAYLGDLDPMDLARNP